MRRLFVLNYSVQTMFSVKRLQLIVFQPVPVDLGCHYPWYHTTSTYVLIVSSQPTEQPRGRRIELPGRSVYNCGRTGEKTCLTLAGQYKCYPVCAPINCLASPQSKPQDQTTERTSPLRRSRKRRRVPHLCQWSKVCYPLNPIWSRGFLFPLITLEVDEEAVKEQTERN